MNSNMSSSSSVCVSAECRTRVRCHEVKYIWIIENFEFYEAKGEVIKSSSFSSVTNGDVMWHLQLKPNGENVAKDTIALYLHINPLSLEKSEQIFTKMTLYILDNQQKELHQQPVAMCNFTSVTKSWGLKQFLKKDANFKNKLLLNNQLTIRCDVTFSDADDFYTSFHRSNCEIKVPECNLAENLALLFENRELTDVVLSANGKDYPAHKNILAARSPVFAAMFRHNTTETEQNRVVIEDISEEVVAEMLKYIYTGKCPNVAKLANELLAAADKYDLGRLKMMCAEALFKTLSVENAANILVLADKHCAKELKYETIEYIVHQFADVLNTTAWKNILLPNPELVTEVCQAVARR